MDLTPIVRLHQKVALPTKVATPYTDDAPLRLPLTCREIARCSLLWHGVPQRDRCFGVTQSGPVDSIEPFQYFRIARGDQR